MNVQVLNKKKKKKINVRRALFIAGMLAIPLIQFGIFFVYVNINSILLTFRVVDPITGTYGWGLDNYQDFFYRFTEYPDYKDAIFNSLMFGLNDLLLVLISLVLAYFFFKRIPGTQFFRIIFFLPSIISIVIYTMAYSLMFKAGSGPINVLITSLGGEEPDWLLDENLARMLVMIYCLWVGTGYNILIFGGAMANINTEVIEYAKLDGVGMFRELFQVILPMIWPTLSVAFIGSVTTVFTLFIQVKLIVGDSFGTPRTIAFLINDNVMSNQEKAATIGIIFTVVATPVILLVRKLIDYVGKKFGY